MNFQISQSSFEQRTANIYKMDSFSTNSIMFAVSVGCFIFLIFFEDNFIYFVSISALVVVFYLIENDISHQIWLIYYTSELYNKNPRTFLLRCIPTGALTIIFCYTLKNYQYLKYRSFLDYYLISILVSEIILLPSSFLRAFLVGSSLISADLIRRGFFAIFQRAFLLLRIIVLSFLWIDFLKINHCNFISLFGYVLIKIGFFFMIFSDILHSVRFFNENKTRLFKRGSQGASNSECPICQQTPIEPIILKCNHLCCYQCIYQWTSRKPICPLCRDPIVPPYFIEMSDSHVPFSIFLISI